jgi:hypothetical protein
MCSLLLRATTTMTIQVISSEAVATKGHNNALLISPTLLVESETGLHKYLLTSSVLRRWLRRIDKINFWCFCGRQPLLLFYAVK